MIDLKDFEGLALELSWREGKKSQVTIANIREMLSHLSDMVYEDLEITIWPILHRNGRIRHGKRIKQGTRRKSAGTKDEG